MEGGIEKPVLLSDVFAPEACGLADEACLEEALVIPRFCGIGGDEASFFVNVVCLAVEDVGFGMLLEIVVNLLKGVWEKDVVGVEIGEDVA